MWASETMDSRTYSENVDQFSLIMIVLSIIHKRWKERFLIGRSRTERPNFQGSPLFQATYNIKTEKQLVQLILCQLDVRRQAQGKGQETDWRFVQLKSVLFSLLCVLDLFSERWHSTLLHFFFLFFFLFFFFLYNTNKEKLWSTNSVNTARSAVQ